MPFCPLFFRPPGGLADAYLAAVVESWPEMVDLLSKPVSIAIMVAGMLGLIVGWFVRGGESASAAPSPPPSDGLVELRWRHEKLVLTERQQVEKQTRLDAFADSVGRHSSPAERTVALRLFVLAERMREARQKTGSDLSRMLAVRERLGAITVEDRRESEVVKTSLRMTSLRSGTLEETRDLLRGIGERALHLEEEAHAGCLDLSDEDKGLRRQLREIKGDILALPQGWATSGDETDRQLRELLAMVRHPAIDAVRDILLIDGAMTLSLAGSGGIDLAGAVGEVMDAIEASRATEAARMAEAADAADGEAAASSDEEPFESPAVSAEAPEESVSPEATSEAPDNALQEASASDKTPGKVNGLGGHDHDHGGGSDTPPADAVSFVGNPFLKPATATPVPMMPPDTAFRDPDDFADRPVRIGKGFHDLTAEPSGMVSSDPPEPSQPTDEISDENRSLVIFCSNDVELWGKDIYRGARCRARAIRDFPDWAEWISIRRLDTGERVFAPVRTASLFNGQTSDPIGFNGTNELFYGARHLGIFSESCPNEVETRFTYGGWGFGHRAHEITPEVEQLQAAGWAGREIPADTVFEIVIHEELPTLGALDRLLEATCGSAKR
ncbi:MAG: hypothetical protein GXX91_04375 [Verrucomicrobiaceae bacterium]|nr:hypothetical protein [Verrucomicrobiaceae bacterium]